MKTITLFAILISISVGCFAQREIEFGLNASGSFAFPKIPTKASSLKSNFASDAGVYVSKDIGQRFSVISGLNFRYQSLKTPVGIGDLVSGYVRFEDYSYNRSSVFIPLKLGFSVFKNVILQSGFEFTFPLNYASSFVQPNWTIGITNRKKRISWSVSYIQSFKEEKISREIEYGTLTNKYKNRMLQLSLSYPLWKSK